MVTIKVTLFSSSNSLANGLKVDMPINFIKAFNIGIEGQTLLTNDRNDYLPIAESPNEILELVKKEGYILFAGVSRLYEIKESK